MSGGFFAFTSGYQELLDLAFLKFYVLARNRVIFPQYELFSHGSGVFLGDIEKPGASCRIEPDLYGGRLSHWNLLQLLSCSERGTY